ncbi:MULTISPECIES: hypothetical protein [unclassified Neorhizobium]|uniref:hypothetical protein n=1 Tax=unclassified Neorhizobium TaxID=2629175 RepID=UPI001FF64339|nr:MULTISPECIES: hypothetical protein [unclassified Neorhizobium]MCJ9673608.1 hypothetical protein [Neorhizobium sp. SHOUNA12B]MCJ9748493.1 hypothetical protein [Neorhizobium sp. SHOUNA12A]
MDRDKNEISDTIGISFTQDRHGWSDLLVIQGGTSFSLQISDVFSDGPLGLLRLCDAILTNRAESVDFLDEPGGHRLAIYPDPEQQHIMTLEIGVLASPDKTEAIPTSSTRSKRKQLLILLMTELWKLHHFHAEPSFQRGRSGFAHAELLLELNRTWDADQRIGPSILK